MMMNGERWGTANGDDEQLLRWGTANDDGERRTAMENGDGERRRVTRTTKRGEEESRCTAKGEMDGV